MEWGKCWSSGQHSNNLMQSLHMKLKCLTFMLGANLLFTRNSVSCNWSRHSQGGEKISSFTLIDVKKNCKGQAIL